MRTTQEFIDQAKTKNITRWDIHNCSLCGYFCGYEMEGNKLFYDSGCDCTGGCTMRSRDWSSLSNHYNMQTHPDTIKRMDEFWGFTKVPFLDKQC